MIDQLIELHARQPILLNAIVKSSTGVVGEYLVAQALEEHGYSVRILANNSRERDIQIAGVGTVEVKSVRGRETWVVRKRPSRADFWVLVRMPKFDEAPIPMLDQVEMFVFSLKEVQSIWDNNPWNVSNPTNGDIRPAHVPDEMRGAWQKIEAAAKTLRF